MATREVVKVQVAELTKYGFKDQNGYVSWSKDISEADKAAVIPGAIFEADYYTSDKGTRYINKIVARTAKVEAPKQTVPATETNPDAERAKRFTPKFEKKTDAPTSAGLTKQEWHEKDVRISRQGLIQACIQAVAPLVALEKVFEEAEKLANQALEYINRQNS